MHELQVFAAGVCCRCLLQVFAAGGTDCEKIRRPLARLTVPGSLEPCLRVSNVTEATLQALRPHQLLSRDQVWHRFSLNLTYSHCDIMFLIEFEFTSTDKCLVVFIATAK